MASVLTPYKGVSTQDLCLLNDVQKLKQSATN